MPHTRKEGRYADRRDDYRNGFVDAIAYLRKEYPPTEQQIADAVIELHRFRRTAAVLARDSASHESSHCSRIDAPRN